MKHLCAVILAACVVSANLNAVADDRLDRRSVNRIKTYCDPVCEVQAQDKAFSMLIEAYRQIQSYQIQSDYEQRLKSAAAVGEEHGSLIIQSSLEGVRTLRVFIEELAKREKVLRMEQLQERVANFHTVYSCVRRVDEEDVGEAVPKRVDTEAASAKLKGYVIVTLGSPATANYRMAKAAPASKIFLDAAPVMIPPDRLIQSCE